MFVDRRLYNTPRYSLFRPKDYLMIVPRQLLSSVAFIGEHTAHGDVVGGTAFFVSVPTTLLAERRHLYLITARHNVEHHSDLFLRLNEPDSAKGGTVPIDLPDGDDERWLFIDPDPGEDFVDVAAIRIPFAVAQLAYVAGYRWVTRSMFFDGSPYSDDPIVGIGIGDDVVTIGLLTVHSGTTRNEPVVRIGNFAMAPHEPVLVKYKTGVNRRMSLFLTELRSIAGLSGSPVFVRMRSRIGEDSEAALLGVMIGHWDDPDDNHMGFGKVVPAKSLARLLDQEAEMKKREALEQHELESGGTAEEDSALEETEFQRFERLAKELVNTPKPKQDES
jgi:hypothetical protein